LLNVTNGYVWKKFKGVTRGGARTLGKDTLYKEFHAETKD
jgi:hypothetical protein